MGVEGLGLWDVLDEAGVGASLGVLGIHEGTHVRLMNEELPRLALGLKFLTQCEQRHSITASLYLIERSLNEIKIPLDLI